MRVLIAEDETLIAENLAAIIRNEGHEVVAIVGDKDEFFEASSELEIDLALLDIRMHNVDLGFEFAEHFKTANIPFVFITSFSDRETVKQASYLRPFGFIMKPFSRDEIVEILDRIEAENEGDMIVLKTGNEFVKLRRGDVCYMNSENVYVNIYTLTDRLVVRAKLTDLCCDFKKDGLIRVHQSFAVNPNYVKRYSESELKLINDIEIPISRKYQSEVKEVLKER